MFLHIGDSFIVNLKDIIAILDIENTTVTKKSRMFFQRAEEKGAVVYICDDMPKSAVITYINGEQIVYISPISCITLRKRANKLLNVIYKRRRLC